jgi:hypothetical protein
MDRTDPNPGGSAGPGPEGRTTQAKAEIYKLMLHEEGASKIPRKPTRYLV